jgi:DNA-binding transcriptional MerR regulator
MKKISEVAKQLNVSADTLRYYEKIKLLKHVQRKNSIRLYTDDNITQIIFIRQAQQVGFSLEEIGELIAFRENPVKAKPKVRKLVAKKLELIDAQIKELKALRAEFTQLTQLCLQSSGDCPILSKFEKGAG